MNVSNKAEQVFKEHIPSKKTDKKMQFFSHNLEGDLDKNSIIESWGNKSYIKLTLEI